MMDHLMPSAPPSFHARLRAALRRTARAVPYQAFNAGYAWGYRDGGENYGEGEPYDPASAWSVWQETGEVPE